MTLPRSQVCWLHNQCIAVFRFLFTFYFIFYNIVWLLNCTYIKKHHAQHALCDWCVFEGDHLFIFEFECESSEFIALLVLACYLRRLES